MRGRLLAGHDVRRHRSDELAERGAARVIGEQYVSSKMEGGPSLSEATRRRIAELDGHPFMWEHPAMIAIILKLKDENRQVRAPSDDRLKAGMKF